MCRKSLTVHFPETVTQDHHPEGEGAWKHPEGEIRAGRLCPGDVAQMQDVGSRSGSRDSVSLTAPGVVFYMVSGCRVHFAGFAKQTHSNWPQRCQCGLCLKQFEV